MITIGCDIGSLFTKAVMMNNDNLVAYKIARTTGNLGQEIDDFLSALSQTAGIDRKKVDCLAGTGIGAELIKSADFQEDIITCLASASAFYLPEVELTIDIGGQSITSILLSQEGEVENFMRNDKCASGSGRFLEMMSDKLNLQLSQLNEIITRANKPVELSAQCGVFAESEVISYVNQGEEVSNIIAGVCATVANMVVAQARRFGNANYWTLTGGVALIEPLAKTISKKLSAKLVPFPHHPQLAGAIGAALLAGSE